MTSERQLLGLVGLSGRGKTTLAERMTRSYVRRGLTVLYVKHTHHDTPRAAGGDTSRLLAAGAHEAWLVGSGWSQRFERMDEPEHHAGGLDEILSRADGDIVLIEGYKSDAAWRCIAVIADAGDLDRITVPVVACISPIPVEDVHRCFTPDQIEEIVDFSLTIGR